MEESFTDCSTGVLPNAVGARTRDTFFFPRLKGATSNPTSSMLVIGNFSCNKKVAPITYIFIYLLKRPKHSNKTDIYVYARGSSLLLLTTSFLHDSINEINEK